MGGSQDLFEDVLDAVNTWTPREDYDDATDFQEALEEFLDIKLNARTGGLADPFSTSRKEVTVKTGDTPDDPDITVGYTEDDPVVAVEVERHLDTDTAQNLRNRIETLLDRYDYVVTCACGIDDEDAWNDLKNQYTPTEANAAIGRSVALIRKRRENYTENR